MASSSGTVARPALSAITRARTAASSSETDRQLLEVARLAHAQSVKLAQYRELASAAISALETMADRGPALIVLNARHTIRVATRPAQTLLDAYFRHRGRDGQPLPEELATWLEVLPADRHQPYVLRRRGRTLTVTAARHADYPVLLLTESGGPKSLTGRETQVLELAARGMTNGAIAHCLDISARTVEEHLARAFGKLGATNRTEAVMKAFGVLDPDRA